MGAALEPLNFLSMEVVNVSIVKLVKLLDLLLDIVNHCDSWFMGHLGSTLFKLLGTMLRLSMSIHA